MRIQRLLHNLITGSLIFVTIRSAELRPNAIIPWSEYYSRLKHSSKLPNVSGDFRRAPQRMTESEEMQLQEAALAEVMEAEKERRNKLVIASEYQKPLHSIRSQARKKLIMEPADFNKLGSVIAKNSHETLKHPPDYHPPLYPEQYPYMKLNNLRLPPGFSAKASMYQPDVKTRLIPKLNYKYAPHLTNEIISQPEPYPQTKSDKHYSPIFRNTKFQSSKNSKAELMTQYAKSMRIPSGVLRNGVVDSVGLPQLPARQHAAPNIGESASAINEISLIQPHFTRIAPASQIDPQLLVSNVLPKQGFPVEQMPGIQQVPLQSNVPNPFEALLSNGNALDQLSKLAKNLLLSGEGGQNNLLTASLRALQRQGASFSESLSGAPQTETRSAPTMMERLMASAAQAIQHGIKEQERQSKIAAVKKEQEEADKHNAPDPIVVENAVKLLAGIPDEQKKLLEEAIRSGEIDVEAVIPAIRSMGKDDATEPLDTGNTSQLINWIKKNRPVKKPDIVLTSDKLPYYGKYCGSFADIKNNSRKYKPSGAVWAVDRKRLIVSKFYFQPGSLTENITFWAGPKNITGNPVVDMFPSSNGFYLKPQPINVAVFALPVTKNLIANVRKAVNSSSTVYGAAPVLPSMGNREKRDTIFVERDEVPPPPKDNAVHLVVQGGMVRIEQANDTIIETVANTTTDNLILNTNISVKPFHILQPEDDPTPDPLTAVPLEWFAGFQPIMLTLPEDYTMESIHWISLWDHKNEEAISSVVFPNGPGFQVPQITTLKPFTSMGLFNVSSGPIKVLDMKTIEVTDLHVQADVPLWFVVGKDILPNANGHIVPIFNEETKSFDCDSLPILNGQNITLRLPGTTDMKDVFWFSIFSLTTGISYSHIYLPYNDMYLPPDLSSLPSPRCVWKP